MIAAEQRSVRANFIFLLGGHVEDEEVEAEQSSEITEGRLINNARRDITAAVRDMTRAEQGLAAIDLKAALAAARDAVNSLQRAFGRNRYFLRTLSARSRIDPSRRLSGRLDAASGWNRNVTDPAGGAAPPASTLAGELTELSNNVARKAGADRSIVERLAERALAIDPGYGAARLAAGQAKFRLGRLSEAQWDLRKLCEIEPRNARAHAALAVVLVRFDKIADADTANPLVLRVRLSSQFSTLPREVPTVFSR